MSWWATLCDAATGETLVSDVSYEEGGTYVMGGTNECDLNVTYNYGGEFRRAWPEEIKDSGALVRMLHQRSGQETAPLLRAAVSVLGTERDPDYWKPTPGNAGYTLSILLRWAEEHPSGIWEIDP